MASEDSEELKKTKLETSQDFQAFLRDTKKMRMKRSVTVEQPVTVEQHYVNPVEGPVHKKKRMSNLCPGCTYKNAPFANKCAICQHKITDCKTVEQNPTPPIVKVCPVCTLENQANTTICAVCEHNFKTDTGEDDIRPCDKAYEEQLL